MVWGRLNNETEPIPKRRWPSTRIVNRRLEHWLLPMPFHSLRSRFTQKLQSRGGPPCPNSFPWRVTFPFGEGGRRGWGRSHSSPQKAAPLPLQEIENDPPLDTPRETRHRPNLRATLALRAVTERRVYAPETPTWSLPAQSEATAIRLWWINLRNDACATSKCASLFPPPHVAECEIVYLLSFL